MASREEANRSQKERRRPRNEEAERPEALLVAVGFPVDSEVDSNSGYQEAVATLSDMSTCNMTFSTIIREASFAHHGDGQYTDGYAVPTVLEEEKTEIVDLASTQIGTFEEATASAAVIETREYELDEDDSLMTRDLKRAAYSGYHAIDRNENNLSSHRASSSPQATIVSIAEQEHGDLALVAVHATFIGQDYVQLGTNSPREASLDPGSSVNESDRYNISGNETAEATVIESAPFHHQHDIPDWKVSGEARVMSGESSVSTVTGCKTLVSESESQASVRSDYLIGSASEGIAASIPESEITNEVVTASQEAEVLGYREIHPSEFPYETTQAELILQIPPVTAAEALVIGDQYEHRARVDGDTNAILFEDNVYDGVEISPLASQQAEVLGIQEDVHPNEFPNETEARLVGQLVETFVASESHCRSIVAADHARYGPEIMEFDRRHLSDETSAHTFLRERDEVDQGQNAILISNGCIEAPSSEVTTPTEHAEAVLISSYAPLNHATALVSTSASTGSPMDASYADEAMVLPVPTGVGADYGFSEKSSGNHLIDYDPDDVLQALEPFQTPTKGMEIPESASSNDRSGGTSASQRAAMQQASSGSTGGVILLMFDRALTLFLL